MTEFTPLNFGQIIAPTGGAVAATGAPQTGLLSSGAGNLLGVLGGGSANAPTDIFNLLLGQGNTQTNQENFTPIGQKIPATQNKSAQTLSLSAGKKSTVGDSIDALQSVLAGLVLKQVPTQGVEKAIEVQTPAVDQSLQGKTLEAYRASAALGQVQPGAIVNAGDEGILQQPFALPEPLKVGDVAVLNVEAQGTPVAESGEEGILNKPFGLPVPEYPAAPVASVNSDAVNNVVQNLLESKDRSPETLSESIRQLKNLSALTPLPQVEHKGKVSDTNKPLEQLASLQAVLAPVKPQVEKVAAKVEAAQQGVVNAVAPEVSTQANVQQQNLSQQFGQKKQSGQQVEAVKEVGEVADTSNTNALSQKVDTTKPIVHDFSSHLHKTAVASPAEQVAVQIAKLSSGKQNITVQLDPAELGKVDVKLEWSADGRSHILIAAERKETLEMLKGDMGSLQRSLADSGIKADASNLQFSLKGQDGFAGQMADGNASKQHGQTAAVNEIELKQAIEDAALAARYVNLNNLLDLRV